MLKYLLFLALVLSLSLFVTVQDEHHAEYPAQEAKQTAPSVASPQAPPKAKGDEKKPVWNAPRWHRLFTWPDGVTVWALFLTLIVIAEQTRETRRAASATKNAADAALIQSDLQKAAMAQWVEVSIGELVPLNSTRDELGDILPSNKLRLSVDTVNNTPYPLELLALSCLVKISSGNEEAREFYFGLTKRLRLTPKGSKGNKHTFTIDLELSKPQFEEYRTGQLFFPVVGGISFQPVIGEPIPDVYQLVAKCAPSKAVELPMATPLAPQ